jgi:prephenate dehydrogenase
MAQKLNLKATFMDVASVKAGVIAETEALGVDMSRFVPTHPIAGRERGGPLNARGDLFQGRSWVLTATELAKPEHVAAAEFVIAACGARAVNLSPAEHDAALALVSHLPQLMASALASELIDAPFDVAVLSGQGLRDSTRIADSDPHLWRDIVTANAVHIAPLVDSVRAQLDDLAVALRSESPGEAVEGLIADGRRGRSRIGATHGGPATPVDVVSVLLRDTPGELARIFLALQHAEVNVADLRIDHAPGQPVGVLELTVAHEAGEQAVAALSEWRARVSPSFSR